MELESCVRNNLYRYVCVTRDIISKLKRYGNRGHVIAHLTAMIHHFTYQRVVTDALKKELQAAVDNLYPCYKREVEEARVDFVLRGDELVKEIRKVQDALRGEEGNDALFATWPVGYPIYFCDAGELEEAFRFLKPYRQEVARLQQDKFRAEETDDDDGVYKHWMY